MTLEYEIACVDVRSLEGSSGTSHLCAVGLWTDISARVLRLPSLDTLYTQQLTGGEQYMYMCVCVCVCVWVGVWVGVGVYAHLHVDNYLHVENYL